MQQKEMDVSIKKIMTVFGIAAALAACLALAGCGGGQSNQAPEKSEPAATEQAAPAASDQAAPAADQAAPAEQQAAPAEQSAPAAQQPQYIGDDKAKEIALKDAGFAAGDVTELKSELDLDDPTVHYDVDFKQGGMEYDYDIDAVSGAIISHNSEVDD